MNKVALIVGAGDSTGGAIARRFARDGYTACVTRRELDKLQPLVAQIEAADGKAFAFGSAISSLASPRNDDADSSGAADGRHEIFYA